MNLFVWVRVSSTPGWPQTHCGWVWPQAGHPPASASKCSITDVHDYAKVVWWRSSQSYTDTQQALYQLNYVLAHHLFFLLPWNWLMAQWVKTSLSSLWPSSLFIYLMCVYMFVNVRIYLTQFFGKQQHGIFFPSTLWVALISDLLHWAVSLAHAICFLKNYFNGKIFSTLEAEAGFWI